MLSADVVRLPCEYVMRRFPPFSGRVLTLCVRVQFPTGVEQSSSSSRDDAEVCGVRCRVRQEPYLVCDDGYARAGRVRAADTSRGVRWVHVLVGGDALGQCDAVQDGFMR